MHALHVSDQVISCQFGLVSCRSVTQLVLIYRPGFARCSTSNGEGRAGRHRPYPPADTGKKELPVKNFHAASVDVGILRRHESHVVCHSHSRGNAGGEKTLPTLHPWREDADPQQDR